MASDGVIPTGENIELFGMSAMIDGQVNAVAPDMMVMAKIESGRRSMIRELLSPPRRYAHECVHERSGLK